MENDWNLFIDLEKEDNKLQKKNHTYINQTNINKNINNTKYNYVIEEKKEEETDFFKKSPLKEKNKYANSFNQYKLKVNKKFI